MTQLLNKIIFGGGLNPPPKKKNLFLDFNTVNYFFFF